MVLEQGLEPESIVCVTFTNKVRSRDGRREWGGRRKGGKEMCELELDDELTFGCCCVWNR